MCQCVYLLIYTANRGGVIMAMRTGHLAFIAGVLLAILVGLFPEINKQYSQYIIVVLVLSQHNRERYDRISGCLHRAYGRWRSA